MKGCCAGGILTSAASQVPKSSVAVRRNRHKKSRCVCGAKPKSCCKGENHLIQLSEVHVQIVSVQSPDVMGKL